MSKNKQKLKELWKNPFKAGQLNHSKRFSKLFNNLDVNETYLNSFKCSYIQNDSVAHGRIYLTQFNMFFYAENSTSNIVLQIKLNEVESIKKERRKHTAIIEDTIHITTVGNNKYLFTNFVIINNLYKAIKKMRTNMQKSETFEIVDVDVNNHDNEIKNQYELNQSLSDNSGRSSASGFISINGESSTSSNEDSLKQSKQSSELTTELCNFAPTTSKMSEAKKPDEEMIARSKLFDKIGKVMIDKEFDVNAEVLFRQLFDNHEFFKSFWGSRKFYGFKLGEWMIVDGYRRRKLEYMMDVTVIGGAKQCKTFEEQKILEYEPTNQIILESESISEGIPYADAFSVRDRFVFTYVDSNRCRFEAKALIFYLKKPNFIAKAFIEKNCNNAMTENMNALATKIAEEIKKGTFKDTQNSSKKSFDQSSENDSNLKSSDLRKRILNEEEAEDSYSVLSLKNNYDSNTNNDKIKNLSITSSSSVSSYDFQAQSIKFTSYLKQMYNPLTVFTLVLVFLLLFLNFYVIYKLNRLEEITDMLSNCTNICTKKNQL